MFSLPVSSVAIDVRLPAGTDELALLETHTADPALAAMLLARLGTCEEPIDWTALPVPDVEAALLRIRQIAIGDLVRTDVRCVSVDCRARVDVAFRISEYLAYSEMRTPRYVEPADEPGWFRLRGTETSFRIPAVADQIAITGLKSPELELERRCVRPPHAPRATVSKAQKAMEAMAPCFSRPLRGVCPECQAEMSIYFDVYCFVLRELRGRAEVVYREVHLIAERYHWPESRILGMPGTRRRQYAEMIADERIA